MGDSALRAYERKIAAVHAFVQSLAIAAAAAFVWAVLWRVTLGVFGFPIFPRTPDVRAICRRRKFEMGKTRYVILFGIFGYGFAFGLALSVSDMTMLGAGWATGIRFLFGVLFFGLWMGLRGWRDLLGQS